LIIGSTSMANPAQIFGNPRPSGRVLRNGDITIWSWRAGYRGYTAQIGSPICGRRADRDGEEIPGTTSRCPGYKKIIAEIAPGKARGEHAGSPANSSATMAINHGRRSATAFDLVHRRPACGRRARIGGEFEEVLKPGMVIMAEPNPITPDGLFGIFLGHTFYRDGERPRRWWTISRWRLRWRGGEARHHPASRLFIIREGA